MITGKVLKLYPSQRALVQLGNQQVTAQLEAALNLNGRYLFQVKSNDQVVQLQVMNEAGMQHSEKHTTQVLQQLGISFTKSRANLVQTLLNQNIPLQKGDLLKAMNLMEKFGDQKGFNQVMVDMLKRKMPIKASIFQALQARVEGQQSLSSTLHSVETDLENQPTTNRQQQLLQQIKTAMNRSTTNFPQQVLHTLNAHINSDRSESIHVLQKAGIMAEANSLQNLKSQMNHVTQNASTDKAIPQALLSQITNNNNSSSDMATRLLNLLQQQLPLQGGKQQQLQQWISTLTNIVKPEQAGNTHNNMDQKQVNTLHQKAQQLFFSNQNQALTQALKNTLSSDAYNVLQEFASSKNPKQLLQQQSASVSNMMSQFQQISGKQLTQQQMQVLVDWLNHAKQDQPQLFQGSKEQFYVQLKSSLQSSGMNLESQLLHNQDHVNQSLKSTVLQAMQDGSSSQLTEKLQTVLHHLNGMALNVQENDQLLQMNLQLPGDWFGLEQDLFMDMEGKKNDNDEIDPDYCHILFYLELGSLKETVIDMRVQKRIVQLTIFSDNEKASSFIKPLKPSLEHGLEQVGYQVSTVRHRSIHESQQESKVSNSTSSTYPQGGFDLKI